jgi:ABC-type spermidine/putrescine transport system permease subunit II
MDPQLEAAAWNLSASQWQAMRYVILPFTAPSIFAALFVTMAVSFDEFAVAGSFRALTRQSRYASSILRKGRPDHQ